MNYKLGFEAPPKHTRERYGYALAGETVYSDDPGWIVSHRMNPTYGSEYYYNKDPDARAAARRNAILAHFGAIKATLADAKRNPQFRETLKLMNADRREVTAFRQPIETPVVGLPDNRWRFDAAHVPAGHDPLPLYVVASDYQPYTDLPLPQGDEVYVLDWSDDLAFLTSISNAGMGKLVASTAISNDEVSTLAHELITAATGKMPPERIAGYQEHLDRGFYDDFAIDYFIDDSRNGLWNIPETFWPTILRWSDTMGGGSKIREAVEAGELAHHNADAGDGQADGYLLITTQPVTFRVLNEFICPLEPGMTLNTGDIVWVTATNYDPFACRTLEVSDDGTSARFERVYKYTGQTD